MVEPHVHDGENGGQEVGGNKDFGGLSHEDSIKAFGDNEPFV